MSERAAGAASTEERATRGHALTGPHVGTPVRERPRPALLSADDEQTLLHAGRVLDQLRAHLAELDRREQSLNSQLTIFDQEQRALRLQAWQSQEEAREREAALMAREAALQERESACAGQSEAAAAERAELSRRQSELDAERERLHADIEQQLADERHALEEQRTTLAREWAALAEESAAWKTQRERELVAHREHLDALRGEALVDIERQLARERGSLDDERETLERERAALARESFDWEARRERELAAHQEQLAALRHDRLADIEEREARLERLQVDLEKRTRFHEDHLARVRSELETRKRELELQRQRQRVWTEQVEGSIRLRLAHVRKFRDLLERREESLTSGLDLLAQSRDAFEAGVADERAQTAGQRRRLDEDRRMQHADLQRQHDLLRLHAQDLDRRGDRLETLRNELERTHRETVELQAAADLACHRLSQQSGEDEAGRRVDEARAALGRQFGEWHASLAAQRSEIEAAEQRLEAQRDEFRAEREAFGTSATRREERLREREQAMTRSLEQTARREQAWLDARERWRHEKQEAQEVVRGLLRELERAAAPEAIVYAAAPATDAAELPQFDERR